MTSIELVLDADATINLRSLGLLEVLVRSGVDLAVTSHAFENELSSLQAELVPHRDSGRIAVPAVVVRTPAHRAYKELLRQKGVDKGEAEAIAWCRDNPPALPRFFVSDDVGARTACKKDPVAISTADCAALLVATGHLTEAKCRELLGVWDDSSKQHGRPKKWRSFDEDFPELRRRVERLL